MVRLAFAAAAVLLGGMLDRPSVAAADDEVTVERIRFEHGKGSATVRGTVEGYQVVGYRLGAKAGQTMTVALTTDNLSNYFNVSDLEGEDELFDGSVSGGDFSATLPKDGDHAARVFLMRNEARRGAVAKYHVSFSITGP